MRHLSALLACLAVSGCSPDSVTATAASGSAAPQSADVHEVVRVDPTTFTSRSLGRVRFDREPPYHGEAIEGGDEMRALVREMNGLDHVLAAGAKRVERTSSDFLRIMQNGWLKQTQHAELRLPAQAPRPARRFDVWRAHDGKALLLGSVDVDARDYFSIVAGPEEHRATLGKLLAERNARLSQTVDIPPPNGKQGRHGRVIERGTPAHFAMVRDELFQSGALLALAGRKVPDVFTLVGPVSRFGSHRWMSVHAPPSLTVIPPGVREHVHLAWPSGAMPAFRVLDYADVKDDEASLRTYVERQYGASQGYVVGEAGTLEVACRKLRALSFRAGGGPAAASRLVALWPEVRHAREGDETKDTGVAIELTIAPGADPPAIAAFSADATLGPVLDSLYVDLERGR